MSKVNEEKNAADVSDESPRPAPEWSFRRTVGLQYDLFDGEGNEIATIESQTHAAMIVRAVNAHDALVEAAKAMSAILNKGWLAPRSEWERVARKLSFALAKVSAPERETETRK